MKEFLKREDVDVNGKDDKGRTLLMMAIADLSEPESFDFVKFLVDRGADPKIADVDGNTVLHKLAAYNKTRQRHNLKD